MLVVFFLSKTKYMQNKIIKKHPSVITIWLAPKPNPIPIAKNKYTNSSGSLIGVLNLITDKAPTKPSDKASEDFTTVITKNVVRDIMGMIFPTWYLPVNELLFDWKTNFNNIEQIIQSKKLKKSVK